MSKMTFIYIYIMFLQAAMIFLSRLYYYPVRNVKASCQRTESTMYARHGNELCDVYMKMGCCNDEKWELMKTCMS